MLTQRYVGWGRGNCKQETLPWTINKHRFGWLILKITKISSGKKKSTKIARAKLFHSDHTAEYLLEDTKETYSLFQRNIIIFKIKKIMMSTIMLINLYLCSFESLVLRVLDLATTIMSHKQPINQKKKTWRAEQRKWCFVFIVLAWDALFW